MFLNSTSSKLWLIYPGGSEDQIELLFAQSFRNLLTTYLQIIYCLELIHQSLAHEAANSYVKERKKWFTSLTTNQRTAAFALETLIKNKASDCNSIVFKSCCSLAF